MLKIFVLIKQVPSLQNLEIDKRTGTLVREGVDNIINPDDIYALELGLSLKEQYGGEVTALTMGPPQSEFALRECLAMGVDDAILITDKQFAYSDTLQTSTVQIAGPRGGTARWPAAATTRGRKTRPQCARRSAR